MKKLLLAGICASSVAAGAVLAAPVRDWRDLDAVHTHVVQAINEMQRARAKNHYDMDGHGARAEALLKDSERELNAAIASSKNAR